jgi:hypothetical protein
MLSFQGDWADALPDQGRSAPRRASIARFRAPEASGLQGRGVSLLDPKTLRCLIYQARPFGCRTHFCEAAGGPYSRREVLDLIRRLERVDAKLGGNGPRPLPDAVDEGLRVLA